MNKERISIESFIAACLASNKHIRLPWNEKEGQKRLDFYTELFKKGLLSASTYENITKDIQSMILDKKIYKQYQKCLKLLKGRGIWIKPTEKVINAESIKT